MREQRRRSAHRPNRHRRPRCRQLRLRSRGRGSGRGGGRGSGRGGGRGSGRGGGGRGGGCRGCRGCRLPDAPAIGGSGHVRGGGTRHHDCADGRGECGQCGQGGRGECGRGRGRARGGLLNGHACVRARSLACLSASWASTRLWIADGARGAPAGCTVLMPAVCALLGFIIGPCRMCLSVWSVDESVCRVCRVCLFWYMRMRACVPVYNYLRLLQSRRVGGDAAACCAPPARARASPRGARAARAVHLVVRGFGHAFLCLSVCLSVCLSRAARGVAPSVRSRAGSLAPGGPRPPRRRAPGAVAPNPDLRRSREPRTARTGVF